MISKLPRVANGPKAEKLQYLRKAWQDGIDSDDAGEIDFAALKGKARAHQAASTGVSMAAYRRSQPASCIKCDGQRLTSFRKSQ